MKRIRIANGSGFWGDSNIAPVRLVEDGPLDYLTFDYLAETTMSILAKQRQKNPDSGYARDFISVMETILPTVAARNIKVIANAGGINPEAARTALLQTAQKLGIKGLAVAIVFGDNILEKLPQLSQVEAMDNMENGEKFTTIQNKIISANAYIGAGAIVQALRQGAQIVITGRCTDTSLTLAPLIKEFGWLETDWHKLATGIVAGHILECGAQSTGGNFTDWPIVPDLAGIGYPICEFLPSGEFWVTKHGGSGGMVSVATVSEQLLYEMGDPKSYITPDVVADFSTIQLQQDGQDCVKVSGIQGSPPPKNLKISIAYEEGYKAVAQFTVAGFNLEEKARLCADIIIKRLASIGLRYAEQTVEIIGLDSCYGPSGFPTNPVKSHGSGDIPSEAVLRLAVKDLDREKVERFGREIAPLLTSGPPGITGFAAGRAQAQAVVCYWPALISRDHIEQLCDLDGKQVSVGWPSIVPIVKQAASTPEPLAVETEHELVQVPLLLLANARSGDKGGASNVGVIARSPQLYAYLEPILIEKLVKSFFAGIVKGPVVRYTVPNLNAFNFILHDSLAGGGASSLKNDAQGKTHGQIMLSMSVSVPRSLVPDSCWRHNWL